MTNKDSHVEKDGVELLDFRNSSCCKSEAPLLIRLSPEVSRDASDSRSELENSFPSGLSRSGDSVDRPEILDGKFDDKFG